MDGITPLDKIADQLDTLVLAKEAVAAGLLSQHVLDHLTSLNPQVPSSMKQRYLIAQLYSTINSNEQLFLRMVQVFIKFQSMATTIDSSAKPRSVKDDFPFGLEDIPDLFEFLVRYAYMWKLIGTTLRFAPEDLENIQACQISSNVSGLPKNCLLQLLTQWVQKKYEHMLAPTVTVLENILGSRILGLGALACEVRRYFPREQNIAIENKALPYFVASLSVAKVTPDDIEVAVIYSKNVSGIEVEENESVLLEVQVAAQENVALRLVEYQWLVNGTPITDSRAHTGTNTPLLCIAEANLDMEDFKYSCSVTIDCKKPVKIEDVPLRVNCPLDQYTSTLASVYSAQPEVPKDTWPPVSSKKHINLALIKQEQINYGAEYAHVTIRGGMDDILRHKEIVEYDQVFNSIRVGATIFIEGRPGCGKTTFVHKITQDWAATSGKKIRILYLVSLRVLNKLNKPSLDLSDILDLFEDLELSKQVIEERAGHGVCFIFDGLDEFSPLDGETCIVYKIINKQYLHKSTVIVASRPAAIAELRCEADNILEVLGFLGGQILEYFDHYPFSDKSMPEKLKRYVSSHPNILHMCYLPIHAAMVAFVFGVTGEVPKTETEIYTLFTRLTLKRSFSKYSRKEIDVCNPCGEEENMFNQICKLALEKTISKKQVLHQNEVKPCLHHKTGQDTSLGLITIDRTAGLYGFKDLYTFLHLTFQEYLAACHISTLSGEEQHESIEKHGDKNHMLVVWKFYCGLVRLTRANFKAILCKTAGRILYHVQCAYESQQTLLSTLLLKNAKYHLIFRDQFLTVSDFIAIGYSMNVSVLHTKLAFINCNMSVEAVGALLLQMEGRSRNLLCGLYFVSETFNDTNRECLDELLTNLEALERLTIRAGQTIDLNSTFSIISKHCFTLTELCVENAIIEPSVFTAILSKDLKRLSLVNSVRDTRKTTNRLLSRPSILVEKCEKSCCITLTDEFITVLDLHAIGYSINRPTQLLLIDCHGSIEELPSKKAIIKPSIFIEMFIKVLKSCKDLSLVKYIRQTPPLYFILLEKCVNAYSITLKGDLPPLSDLKVIGYSIDMFVLPTKLSLITCALHLQAVDALLSQITDTSRSLLYGLHVESETLNDTDTKCINRMLTSLRSLQTLTIKAGWNGVDMNIMCSIISNCCTGVTELCIENAILKPSRLADVLKSCKNITKLSLVNSVRDVQSFADSLKFCTNLEELDVRNNEFDDTTLVRGLKFCKKLDESKVYW